MIAGDSLALQLEDMGGNAVKEIAVMGDNQHPAAVILQEAFQPLDHLDVQVVGRLIQKEEIRLPQQGLGQADAGLLSPGEVLDIFLELILCEAQAVGNAADTALIVVATQELETLHHAAIGSHSLLIVLFRNGLLQRFLALTQLDDVLKGPLEFLEEGAIAEVCLLLHIADGSIGIKSDGTPVAFFQPHQAAHEGGLACAVRPHEAHLVPSGNLEIHIAE